ncbi:MAG TPA: SGNH/GDSL hydrolase family protein [Bryobacteraceae bacterium]|nr:SGNH/GDSL hydrolase family protein [Bryobacteraceae bacterium]
MTPTLLLAAAIAWIAPQDPRFTINGLPWFTENKGEFIRLPHRLEADIPKVVWTLGESPSGGRIRFRTNSSRLSIRLDYPSAPNMANMHAFGQTGVDLYIDGIYRSTAIAPKDAVKGKIVEHVYFENFSRQQREITLYLPLYKPVNVVSLGLDDDAVLEKPKRFVNSKPLVFYGTSITQGGCASRSGLSYEAILARKLNLDFINLGFSGNGKGEPVMANLVADIDASAFIFDFSQNNPDMDSLRQVYEPFLKAVRTKHPKTPIIAITPIASSTNVPRFEQFRQHIREVVGKHIAAGDSRLTLLEGYALLGPGRLDGLVDGVHPNDLGFQWMADGLAPIVAKALNLAPPQLVDDSKLQVTPESAAAKRKQIVDFIWGAGGITKAKPADTLPGVSSPIAGLKNVSTVEKLTIKMEAGQENTTFHFQPKQAKTGSLVILQHGHGCTFDDGNDPKGYGLAHAVDSFLGAGFGVLTAHMPHMRDGDCRTMTHAAMFDLKISSGNALKFFLEPVIVSLNALRTRYKEVHMAGLSGGGWTTTLLAAVDPSIKASFPVAGAIPLYLRTGDSIGDKEQYLEEFYKIAGYQDLFFLGAYGQGRKQIQILNRRDDCCFGEAQHSQAYTGMPYGPAMRSYETRVREALGNTGQFRLEIDEDAPRHMISPQAVEIMLKELAK